MAENKIEIKLITEYRTFLLGKIDNLKESLTNIASSFGDDLTSSIEEFSCKINGKLKTIDERFTKNSDELEALKAELLSKKFDESNFNNVSMIRTLDKTIKERDLKIKELESRIRYLEGNSTNANVVAKKEQEPVVAAPIKQKKEAVAVHEAVAIDGKESVPITEPELKVVNEDKFKDAPRVQDADGDIVIAVSAKKSRSKKKTETANPAAEVANVETEPIVEEKPKKVVRKIKKASKIEKEEDEVKPVPEPVREQDPDIVDDAVDAAEEQRLADEEALRLAEEEAKEAERLAEEQRLAEEESLEAERLVEEQRLEEEHAAKAAAAEQEKKKNTEFVKKPIIAKKDSKDSKESSTSTKKITAKTTVKSAAAPPAPATAPISKPKETSNVKNDYPDKLPELEDLDVITVDGNDYYCDKNNQGVYQMVNGDDIGAFLGYFTQDGAIAPVEST
jgi:hypothetical protein